MADDTEFGEFSSVSEGWSDQNHVTTSFNPDWLVYSDNQDWTASGVVPNNEHPWNASLPELPKELSNLLSDEMTSLDDINALPVTIADLPTNGSGQEFGNFEFSLDSEVVMTTNDPITDINVTISTDNSDITNKLQSMSAGGGVIVDEDDEFGDFEGPSIPKQPEMVQAANVVVSELQDEAEDEFGGFLSTTTTTEVKQKVTVDDDFGSFEAAEFVAVSSFPPLQTAQPTASTVVTPPTNFVAPPTNEPPPTFSTVAESCFHCDQTGPATITDHQSLNTLAEQSSLWSSLQSGLKTTSPLYAWNKSHVEDQYFAALRVDPMLVYTILSFAEEMGMAPLAPQDQLLADEGFQWPDSPTEERPKEVAATLLDLTLSSPVPAASSKVLGRHDSFTLDADLMGLDFTLTDDPQLTAMIGEGLPDPVMIEASNSKTADAIADILGLTTNPYLTTKDDNQLTSQDKIDQDNNLLIGQDDQLTNKKGDHKDELTSKDNQLLSTSGILDNTLFTNEAVTTGDTSPAATNNLSQPLESLAVSKDHLQSLMPSQETLDALKVSPTMLQSLVESDSKPVTNNNRPESLSNAALDLLSALPVLPESSHPPGLSMAAQDLLTSLPDVMFMLSNTHTEHTRIQQ